MKFLSSLLLMLLVAFTVSCGETEKDNRPENEADIETEAEAQPSTPADYVEQAVFTDFEGNEVSISEFKGKVVMIDFWETWCKPCLASFPTLQKLLEEYPERFVVLAVTPGFTDTAEDAQQFAEEHDYDFIYLMDSKRLSEDLQVQGIPFKVFVDAEGKFIKTGVGNYGPEEDYKMVKEIIEEHTMTANQPE